MFSVLRRSTEHSQMDKKEGDTPIIASIKVTSKSPNQSQIQHHAGEEENDLAPKCGGAPCVPISKCINRLKIQLAHPALTLSSNRQKRDQQHFTASSICITAPHRKRSERISATAYATTLAITYDTKRLAKTYCKKHSLFRETAESLTGSPSRATKRALGRFFIRKKNQQ
jgi:hypothetical protein